MQEPSTYKLPLDSLLISLEEVLGRRYSPEIRAKSLVLLRTLNIDIEEFPDKQQLKYLLRPLLTSNQIEQEKFNFVYENWFNSIVELPLKTISVGEKEKEALIAAPQESSVEDNIDQSKNWKKYVIIGGVCLAIGVSVVLTALFKNSNPIPVADFSIPQCLEVSMPIQVINLTEPVNSISDFRFTWEWNGRRDSTTSPIIRFDTSGVYRITLTVRNKDSLTSRISKEVFVFPLSPDKVSEFTLPSDYFAPGQKLLLKPDSIIKSLSYQWRIDGIIDSTLTPSIVLPNSGSSIIELLVKHPADTDEYCISRFNKRLVLAEELENQTSSLPRIAYPDLDSASVDGPVIVYIWNFVRLFFLVCVFFSPLIIWLFLLRLWFFPRLPDEINNLLESADTPPLEILWPEQNAPINYGQGYDSLMKYLQKRHEVARRDINVNKSIKRTLSSRGLPFFVYLEKLREPSYVFLIESQSEQDHIFSLFLKLTSRLAENGVHIHVFSFSSSLLNLKDPQKKSSVRISDLARKYPDSALFIIEQGNTLVTNFPIEELEELDDLTRKWTEKNWITTKTFVDWGQREQIISEKFTLLPAYFEVQATALENQETDLDKIKQLANYGHPEYLFSEYKKNNLDHIRLYLGEKLFRIFRAIMVYPDPSWNLTMAIAIEFQKEYPEEFRDILSYESLLRLGRIPYLREGYFPPKMREELLQKYSESEVFKHDVETARRVLVKTLRKIHFPENSRAQQEKTRHIIINQAAINPKDEKTKSVYRRLQQEGLVYDDFILDIPDQQYQLFSRVGRILTFILGILFSVAIWYQNDLKESSFFTQIGLAKSEVDSVKLFTANGLQSYENQKYDSALNWYVKAMRLDSSYKPARQNFDNLTLELGISSFNNGDYTAAQAFFQQGMLQFNSKWTSQRLDGLIQSWQELGNFDSIEHYLEISKQLRSDAIEPISRSAYAVVAAESLNVRGAPRSDQKNILLQVSQNDTLSILDLYFPVLNAFESISTKTQTSKFKTLDNTLVLNDLGNSIVMAGTPLKLLDSSPSPNDYYSVIDESKDTFLVFKYDLENPGYTTWYKVEVDGKEGWVDEAFVKIYFNPSTLGSQENYINDDSLDYANQPIVPEMVLVPCQADSIFGDFSIGKYEVTNREFAYFLNNANASDEEIISWYWYFANGYNGLGKPAIKKNAIGRWIVVDGFELYPANYVSWYGAQAYCQWLTQTLKDSFRLPTVQEWESAAKSGNPSAAFASGANNNEAGWVAANSEEFGPRKVGQMRPNPYGIFDMSGNLWEWCDGTLQGQIVDDKVAWLKGGAWFYYSRNARINSKISLGTSLSNSTTGFRVIQIKN